MQPTNHSPDHRPPQQKTKKRTPRRAIPSFHISQKGTRGSGREGRQKQTKHKALERARARSHATSPIRVTQPSPAVRWRRIRHIPAVHPPIWSSSHFPSHTGDTAESLIKKNGREKKNKKNKEGEPIHLLFLPPPFSYLFLIQIHLHLSLLHISSSCEQKFPIPISILLLRRRCHGRRRRSLQAASPALPGDDTGGDRGAEREERVEQVGDLQVHRGEVRRPAAGARVAAHGAPGEDEGVRRAHLPQEQLLPRRRARRAAQEGEGTPAQATGPQRAAAAAQAVLAAPPRPPAQVQGPHLRRRRAGHLRHAQVPRPPAQEGQDDSRPGSGRRRRRRRLRPRQARPRPATQGTPRRAQRGGGGLTNPFHLRRGHL